MSPTSENLEFAIVDVFTDKRYEGNPLAIVRLPASSKLTQEQKQNIAREFNLSETTFLHEPTGGESCVWTVDIFMTQAELPFAGHPTIGTACLALSEAAEKDNAEGIVRGTFNLKAGPVQLQYDTASKTAKAAIPHDVHVHKRVWTRDELLAQQPALAEFAGDNQKIPIVSIVKGMTFVLIELESLDALQKVQLTTTVTVDGLDQGWNETFVGTYFYVQTSNSGGVRQLRTRMIEGSLEDPATGSAASDLAAYLSLLDGKPGQTLEFAITQGVEMGRRSEIAVSVLMGTEKGIETITLGGGAIPVMEGRLRM
ncbi:phenazine biosynthesis protein-like protein PhzF family [Karstenula rhodostoma CBS 690.94]|uniref:Phenazine biosynthesis protein-like protein PhzF family n=1 Tax=Karstenula rhodostoma CBS 690.94 TaxID=1392251 RepID=A0A9P4PUC1_9PLEO|nr:phenazine biosynthesis protein-like protein PhzF family [Karstenula rhodostoma CBS 690.94]